MKIDWLLSNGHIETFEPGASPADAIAVTAGRIVAIGSSAELEASADAQTRRTDLSGRTVFPGFIDTHMHLEKVSHELTMLRLEHDRTVADVLEQVRTRALDPVVGGASGIWIRCFADQGAWNEANLAEGRLPSRVELDVAAPTTPVYLYRRPDHAVINSAGAALMAHKLDGLPLESYNPESGYLFGPAVRVLNDAIYTASMDNAEYRQQILAEACQKLLAKGITTIVDPGLAGAFDPAWALYQEATRRGTLPQRIRLMNRFDWRQSFDSELSRVENSMALPGDGDDRLQAWALKLLLDGEFTNAWMRDGEDTMGESHPHYTLAELRRVLEVCAERNWPICIHAMGGGAIRAVTDTVQQLADDGIVFTPGLVNIAHAFMIDVLDMRECVRLGIKLSVNPVLAYVYSDEMKAAWGPLAARTVPLATMASLGLRFAAGSDTHPTAPLAGASVAVLRTAWDGSTLGSHEALTPRQALTMFTRDAGDYVNQDEIGTLAVGSVADFTIWSANPLELPPTDWPTLTPDLVAISGEPVWPA